MIDIKEIVMKKISHSGWVKYQTCPKIYEYHYCQRLRPKGTSSALVFGSAIDKALNVMLLEKNLDKSVEEFRNNFVFENMVDVVFDYKDFDRRLLSISDITKNPDYNAFKSLRVKGRLLLEAYYNEILPQIEEVECVQKELSDRSGIIDAIVKLRGRGRVILDNKTSARPYDSNVVANDTQLAIYSQSTGIDVAAFAVLVKEIQYKTKKICSICDFDGSVSKHKTCNNSKRGKRCHGPWVETSEAFVITQLLVDKVPEITKQIVSESFSETERAIESSIYPRNLKSCGRIYGKPCPYINKCWQNKDDGLQIVPEEVK